MDDMKIVDLYWERNTAAIRESFSKYGGYCKSIAWNILSCNEDAEECVNDTFLKAWNSIPPNRPNVLSTYLGKITRNLALDRYRKRCADKRGGGEIELILDELSDCSAGGDHIEQEIEQKELVQAINDFLGTLSQKKCNLFLCRYWYAMPVSAIASSFGMTEGNVSVTLCRIRNKLRKYLAERGYHL